MTAREHSRRAEAEALSAVEARKEAEVIHKEAEVQAKDVVLNAQKDAEQQIRDGRREIQQIERRVQGKEETLEKRLQALDGRETEVSRRETQLRDREGAVLQKERDNDALVQETPYSFKRPQQLTETSQLRASCQPNRGPDSAPLFLINHWIDTSPAPKPSNAAKVNALWNRGDQAAALEAQAQAKKWTKIAFILGAIVWVLSIGINACSAILLSNPAYY